MRKTFFLITFIFLLACENETSNDIFPEIPTVKTKKEIFQKGIATWYGPGFDGRKTSSGQIYDMYSFTAAHLELPLGTIIRVRNVNNNRSTVVLVNDRGPVNTSLILDLSKIAANNIDIVRKGSGKVELEVLTTSKNPLEKIFELYRNIGNEI
ncbi:MAG: septal ring lytic transglycosylase RlpA family protein [Bacteroidales bacterium]|nr:septal ring lytic transglycosylase RlpA family protein [Bacteroidales bacterium]